MSILQSELEVFDGLMESVSKKIATDPSRSMMESVSIKNTRLVLDEAQVKRKKDYQKKKTNLIGKKKIVIDAKKVLKGLYEAVLNDSGYVADTETKANFFEGCKIIAKSLTEMDNSVKAELDTLVDLDKKYNDASLTPDQISYLKSQDPDIEIDHVSTDLEKKKPLNQNNPNSL